MIRECATASRADARNGDSLIEILPKDQDGFESTDRLSLDQLLDYLRDKTLSYLRCEIVNAR